MFFLSFIYFYLFFSAWLYFVPKKLCDRSHITVENRRKPGVTCAVRQYGENAAELKVSL